MQRITWSANNWTSKPVIRALCLLPALIAGSLAWAAEAYTPTDEAASKYSVERAADYVQRGLANCVAPTLAKVQVMPDIVTVAWPDVFYILQFRDLRDIKASFTEANGGFLKPFVPGFSTFSADGHFFQGREYPNTTLKCTSLGEDWMKVLADALLRLKLEYDRANNAESLARFKDEAVRYQAMDPKPQIPEDARRLRVQAEQSVAVKQFLEAADKYGQAIALVPWWPEAHFNRAVVLAELQNFDSAISEMKRYLILRPDAPDARQAQDFIYAWETHPFAKK